MIHLWKHSTSLHFNAAVVLTFEWFCWFNIDPIKSYWLFLLHASGVFVCFFSFGKPQLVFERIQNVKFYLSDSTTGSASFVEPSTAVQKEMRSTNLQRLFHLVELSRYMAAGSIQAAFATP